ncbi:hypothetical protein BASA61_008811 [Batrachochytrium salamandrivorans]|nr:hypothetical protein BASA62_010451 [Batrachochytrium salamandrivorans]KAH6581923.1 hypothetical protein BASA61_008811 [Batrachochytrium salamandrivorans]KAH9270253.1 hypothetical protein BASA83_007591 [Batrachochytrium salamandrivorans]KAJ1336469.1 hypothetical protein BSLG_007253 [Batrachochytrium salamandrivorans]
MPVSADLPQSTVHSLHTLPGATTALLAAGTTSSLLPNTSPAMTTTAESSSAIQSHRAPASQILASVSLSKNGSAAQPGASQASTVSSSRTNENTATAVGAAAGVAPTMTAAHKRQRHMLVFVDPDDAHTPYWWPAMVVPHSEYSLFKRTMGPNVELPGVGQLLVCYFEDASFSVVSEADTLPFGPSLPPYTSYLAGPSAARFRKDKAVLLATDHWQTGRVPPFFTWLASPTVSRDASPIRKQDLLPPLKHQKVPLPHPQTPLTSHIPTDLLLAQVGNKSRKPTSAAGSRQKKNQTTANARLNSSDKLQKKVKMERPPYQKPPRLYSSAMDLCTGSATPTSEAEQCSSISSLHSSSSTELDNSARQPTPPLLSALSPPITILMHQTGSLVESPPMTLPSPDRSVVEFVSDTSTAKHASPLQPPNESESANRLQQTPPQSLRTAMSMSKKRRWIDRYNTQLQAQI